MQHVICSQLVFRSVNEFSRWETSCSGRRRNAQGSSMSCLLESQRRRTADLWTKILDFSGFDSSRVLSVRGGILLPIGDFPESLSQAILVGIILVGRLGVAGSYDNACRHQSTMSFNFYHSLMLFKVKRA